MSDTSLLRACNLPGKVLHKRRRSSKARAVEAAAATIPIMLAVTDIGSILKLSCLALIVESVASASKQLARLSSRASIEVKVKARRKEDTSRKGVG